ncbi:MAG: hypothetical protein LAO03_10810 [Acidobacteriia bacterium]|nr:hypothetical protein [Terriglobia bacterium]
MPSFRKFFWLILVLLLSLHPVLNAQPAARPGRSSSPTLGQLTRKAGYVFDGTVLSVVRVGTPHDVPAVQITFRIERGIRGTQTGQLLTVREWAGLWESGERYRPGERVLLFLYPPSKLGLTSPVGGALGRFAVDARGFVNMQPGRGEALPASSSVEPQSRGRHRLRTADFARAIQRSQEE